MVAPGPSLSMAPPLPSTPAPPPARLPVKTELVMVAVEGCADPGRRCSRWHRRCRSYPSPAPSAWLLVNVLSVTVSVAPPKLSMPPPTLPPKKEPPPPPRAWLPLKVEETTVAVPSLSRPPPKTSTVSEEAVAVLLVRAAVVEGQGGPGLVEDAAPAEAADGRPVGDRQAGDGHGRPALMSKTRLALLPLMVSLSAPAPRCPGSW